MLDPTEYAAIAGSGDLTRGLPNRAYTCPDWAAAERERMLGAGWTCVGFEADLAPGSARPVDLLGLPLVLVRDGAGETRVFHNVCPHRGHRMVDAAGPLPKAGLVCPYHFWTFDHAGALRRTPHIGGSGVHQVDGFDPCDHGLREVRSARWMGLVFINLSGDAPALADRLAPLLERWSRFVPAGDLDRVRTADEHGVLEFELACNWKLVVENYLEAYHLPMVHPGLNAYSRLEDHYGILGDGLAGQGSTAFNFATLNDIALPRFGAWPDTDTSIAEYVALYPNLLIGIHADHLFAIILFPTGVDRTVERLRLLFVDDSATGQEAAPLRRTLIEGWRQVFVEDIGVVESMQKGRHSPGFDGGVLTPLMDQPTRHFHQWAARQMMANPAKAAE